MTLKNLLVAGLSAIGIGNAAAGAPSVSTLDPRKISFTLPTVAADDLQFEVPTQQSFEGAPQFHEDTWRQLEFYPDARLAELQGRLKEYKAFEQRNRIANGWKDIYARRIPAAPVLGTAGTKDVAEFLRGKLQPAPILTTTSSPLGQVKGGFTVRINSTVFLYGVTSGAPVTVLGAVVEQGGDDQALTAAFTRLHRQYKVILVDWRSQMVLVDVDRTGGINIWRP